MMNISVKNLPSGAKFLETVAEIESQCFAKSLAEIPNLGISTPASYESLGNVLSMLYAEAACLHGCSGGDHFFQRLTARVVTHSLSSLRLAMLGYYDESLSLTRSIGEIANLLFFFAAQPAELESWRSADDQKRKKEFSPVKVRLKLEKLNLRPPVDHSRYSLLCEIGVHVTPSVSPQTFNEHGRSSLGASFQYEGLICTINELGIAVAEAAACLSVFPHVHDRSLILQTAAQVLLNMIGNLDLEESNKAARRRG
jgi:hypothetical protein